MKKILLFLVLFSCAHQPKEIPKTPPIPDDFVTIEAAVKHLTISYLKGCIEAFHELKIPKAFDHCRAKAELHRQEVQQILDQ